MTAFLKLLDQTHKLAQSFQVEQRGLLGWKGTWCGRIAGPTGGNSSMVAIEVPNDEIGISTATNTNDLHLLATERVIGMGHGDPSRNSLGQWGSVLWGCPSWWIAAFRQWSKMLLNQPGRRSSREQATASVQAEAAMTPSRKSSSWPDRTRPRSGCSMPTSKGHSTISRTTTS